MLILGYKQTFTVKIVLINGKYVKHMVKVPDKLGKSHICLVPDNSYLGKHLGGQ